MHVLGYFLPPGTPELDEFLCGAAPTANRRAGDGDACCSGWGSTSSEQTCSREAEGGAVGRPHVARALVRRGVVATVSEAFDRYLGRGRPAFVEKALPTFAQVAALVHQVGGIVSAAHLKDRGTRSTAGAAQAARGSTRSRPGTRATIRTSAPGSPTSRSRSGSHRTGGSDWHGDPSAGREPRARSARSRCRSSGWSGSRPATAADEVR